MAANIIATSEFYIKTVEMHTGGDPVRIIVSGYPAVSGKTLLSKLRYVRDTLDHLRKALMFEPRGHRGMYGVLLVEPDHPDADLAAVPMDASGYPTMCGHASIALARYAVDFGIVKPVSPETQVNIQMPCGLIEAFVEYDKKRKTTGIARLLSRPAYVFKRDVQLDIPGAGQVSVDICYGGMFYVVVPSAGLGLDIHSCPIDDAVTASMAVLTATREALKECHPDGSDLTFPNGTIITDGEERWSDKPTTAICVCDGSLVVRSPCGSGVISRVALQVQKGLIDLGQTRTFTSGVTGSSFTATPIERATERGFPAVVVEIAGKGFYVGQNTFFGEANDETGEGFLLS